jgi:hypothetical protein
MSRLTERTPRARNGVDHCLRLFETLLSVYGLLNPLIEILHAQARPCQTYGRQRIKTSLVHIVGIDLDTDFGIIGKAELFAQAAASADHVLRLSASSASPHRDGVATIYGAARHQRRDDRIDLVTPARPEIVVRRDRSAACLRVWQAQNQHSRSQIGNMDVERRTRPLWQRAQPAT